MDPIIFGTHMCHRTGIANALTTTSWFYSLYSNTPNNQNQRDFPSVPEILFLLDIGFSIFVPNFPTYITNAKLPNITGNDTFNTSKPLTVANQTKVPILHYVTLTLNTTIEDDTCQFISL